MSTQVAERPRRHPEVWEGVAGVGSESVSRAYMVRMWQQVLRSAEDSPGGHGLWRDECYQLGLPYVPIDPERFGIELTTRSAVLDVGTMSGYGLFDFARRRRARNLPVPELVGVDIDDDSCAIGRRLAGTWAAPDRIRFCLADCQALPFPPNRFDLVVARTVLPYVDMSRTIAELARVVRWPGLILLQIHAPGYYLAQLRRHVRSPARLGYYVRPLLSAALLTYGGRQPRHRWFRETAVTVPALRRLAARQRLRPVWVGHARHRPMILFRAG